MITDMKKYILLLFPLVLLLFQTSTVISQTNEGGTDKYSLLTEPFNLRPINVHKGQFQINTGYRMSVRTKYYDANGDVIGLTEDGSASIQHSYLLNIKYGVLEFLELGAEMNFQKKGVREPTRYFLNVSDIITVNTLREYNGFEDIFLHASLSLPFDIDLLDFALKGGISLSSAKHKPDKPTHSAIYLGLDSYDFNYHYNYNNGTGTPVWKAGADFQISFNKLTLYSTALFSSPLNEVESLYWTEFLENVDFIYTPHKYEFLPQETLNIYASLHYQAISWLDLSLAYNHNRSMGGWISQNSIKYSIPEQTIDNLDLGFEIQISPLVRLTELAGFTIGGNNIDAPFYILTSLSFNIIPF